MSMRWKVGLTSAVLLVALFFYPGPRPKTSPLVARIAKSTDRPVEIQVRLQSNFLENETDADELDVSVVNYGTVPLQSLRLTLVAPGFAMDGQPAESVPQSGLAPGQSYVFKVPMRAAAWSGSYSIASLVSWTDTAPQARSVTVGPVIFDGPLGAARWSRFAGRFASLVKDLALPLLLLILTTMFSRRQSEKERLDRVAEAAAGAAKSQAEADLESIRQDEQRKREERLQVTRLLLERVMDLAQNYYLPIVAAAKLAFRDIERCGVSPATADYSKVTYDLFRLIHLFDLLRKEKGGLFLRSGDGEYVIGYTWEFLKETLVAILTPDQVNLCIADKNLLGSFGSYTNGKGPFEVAERRVKAWLVNDASEGLAQFGKYEDYVGSLDVIQAVLRHEVNRPFWDYWYEHQAGETLQWDFMQPETHFPPDAGLTSTQKNYVLALASVLPKYCGRGLVRP